MFRSKGKDFTSSYSIVFRMLKLTPVILCQSCKAHSRLLTLPSLSDGLTPGTPPFPPPAAPPFPTKEVEGIVVMMNFAEAFHRSCLYLGVPLTLWSGTFAPDMFPHVLA